MSKAKAYVTLTTDRWTIKFTNVGGSHLVEYVSDAGDFSHLNGEVTEKEARRSIGAWIEKGAKLHR